MRVSVKTFASALAAYNKLIHWGQLEYREDLRGTRQEAFDDLREGLVELQGVVADDASFAAMLDARLLVDRAMVVYRVGSDIDACSTLLQRSLEAIQSVQFKTGRDDGDVRRRRRRRAKPQLSTGCDRENARSNHQAGRWCG